MNNKTMFVFFKYLILSSYCLKKLSMQKEMNKDHEKRSLVLNRVVK